MHDRKIRDRQNYPERSNKLTEHGWSATRIGIDGEAINTNSNAVSIGKHSNSNTSSNNPRGSNNKLCVRKNLTKSNTDITIIYSFLGFDFFCYRVNCD